LKGLACIGNHTKYLVLQYTSLLVLFSVPFWVMGAGEREPEWLSLNLPLSALMFVCPLAVAWLLSRRDKSGHTASQLIGRAFDWRSIPNKAWLLPVFFLQPVVMIFSYVVMMMAGQPVPEPSIPYLEILLMFLVFFIAALCEEAGWTVFLTPLLLSRTGVLGTGMLIGTIWGLWHVIPYIQAGHSASWILWQIAASICNRIVMVWIYRNSGGSAFTGVAYHAMINVSVFAFPVYGSHYDPAISATILGLLILLDSLYARRRGKQRPGYCPNRPG